MLNAAYGAGGSADNNRLFEELAEAGDCEAWNRAELYFFALTADQPITHYVELSSAAARMKAGALMLHRSQYPINETTMMDAITWTGQTIGHEVEGLPAGAMVEAWQGFF